MTTSMAALALAASLSAPADNLPLDRVTSPPACHRLTVTAGDPWAYRARGDRCEGAFVIDQAGEVGVHLLALLDQSTTDAGAGVPAAAVLSWTGGPPSGTVFLLGRSLREDIVYRMETQQPAASQHYRWPLDVLQGRWGDESPWPDVALLAFVESSAGPRVYLPVQVQGAPIPSPAAPGSYLAVVETLVRIKSIGARVSWSRPAAGTVPAAAPCSRDRVDIPLPPGGEYERGEIVRLPIPKAKLICAGVYEIELDATASFGSRPVKGSWLFENGGGTWATTSRTPAPGGRAGGHSRPR